MPGRLFVGLSANEKHPGQFRPPGLPDKPSISRGRVMAGTCIGLLVFGFTYGSGLTWTCNSDCLAPTGSDVPIIVCLLFAVPVAVVVIAWPHLSFQIKRWLGRI